MWSVLGAEGDLPPGELVVVDPLDGVAPQIRARLPDTVSFTHIQATVERSLDQLPPADAVVCSLTLHHVAGRDAAERARHGMTGPGKREVLEAFGRSLRARGARGLLILNEADVHCEVDLPSGEPLLVDRLIDSYVRRTAVALCREIRASDDAVKRLRLAAIVERWCLMQVARAELPVAERDVFELDVPRWLAVLGRSGFAVEGHAFTDMAGLFQQYQCRLATDDGADG